MVFTRGQAWVGLGRVFVHSWNILVFGEAPPRGDPPRPTGSVKTRLKHLHTWAFLLTDMRGYITRNLSTIPKFFYERTLESKKPVLSTFRYSKLLHRDIFELFIYYYFFFDPPITAKVYSWSKKGKAITRLCFLFCFFFLRKRPTLS